MSKEESPLIKKMLNLDQIDLAEFISEPTREVPEVAPPAHAFQKEPESERPELGQPSVPSPSANSQPLQPTEKPVSVKTYDPKKNANAMVHALLAIENMILPPIAVFKLKKSIGGKEVLGKMLEVRAKSFTGESLTTEDNRILKAFEKYKKDVEILQEEFLPGEAKTRELIKMAIPFMEESEMEFNSGAAFAISYGSQLVEKIMKLVTS